MKDRAIMTDKIESNVGYARESREVVTMKGTVHAVLYDENMNIKAESLNHNIVTTQGDAYFVDRLTDNGAGTQVLMVLGTGTANVAKANTWVAGYFAGNGSAAAGNGLCTVTTDAGTASTIKYVGTFSAGYATQNNIQRAILTNINPAADGNGTPNASTQFCIAHGTVSPTINKGTADTLVINWYITLLGA